MSEGKGAAPAAPNPDGIPEELRELDRWVVWRFEERDGKATKVPLNAVAPTSRASTTDPKTWAPFETAVAVAETAVADGIGFVLADGDGLVGIDLDACFAAVSYTRPPAASSTRSTPTPSARSRGWGCTSSCEPT